MEPEWAVIIGIGAAGLLREIYLLIKVTTETNAEKSKKKLASIVSIVLGLMVFIPFIGVMGIAVGVYAYRKTIYTGLAITGILLSSISTLLWIIIALNGA
jgi:hypothetical protein